VNRDETLSAWMEEAIASGATHVEAIHKAIVDLPLKRREQSGALDQAMAEVHKVEALSIDAVYDPNYSSSGRQIGLRMVTQKRLTPRRRSPRRRVRLGHERVAPCAWETMSEKEGHDDPQA